MKKRGWTAADTAVCAATFDELATAKERTDGRWPRSRPLFP